MGGTYTQQGDYVLPNLILPAENQPTLTVIYTDGEASGGFEVLSKDGPIIPQTGYNGDIALWITLLSIAACAIIGTGTMACSLRKKHSK